MKKTVKCIKPATLFFFIILMQVSARGFSQKTVTYSGKQTSLEQTFSAIEQQTGYSFFYNVQDIAKAKKIDVNVKNVPLEQALTQILKNDGYKFSIKGRTIVVSSAEGEKPAKPVATTVSKIITTIDVEGKITNEKGEPLNGATISIIGKTKATVTNENGLYKLTASDTDSLEFTYVGYEPQRIAVNHRTEINITLKPAQQQVSDVVVVGYGKQKKASVVGSQVTINPEELKLPVRDLTTAIAGRLSGVIATQRSGAPGQDAASILIRGVSTFASSPQGPLLVVDGVPDRSINNIDPEDVESFTVLKDASATAVYGTRGANGVILINTKKGKAGKPKINAEVDKGVTKFTELPKLVDGPTYMNLYNEALTTRGRNAFYSQTDIDKTTTGSDPDLYPNVDWFKTLFNDYGSNSRATLNVNGGSENASYYVSVGYYGETGMYKRDASQSYNSSLKLDRFNFTSNVSANLTKTTKMELGINGYITNVNAPSAGLDATYSQNDAINKIFGYAVQIPSISMPVRFSNGQWPQPQSFTASPYMYLTQSGYSNSYNNVVRSNLRGTQDLSMITKGLSLTGMFAFDIGVTNNLYRTRTIQTYYIADRNNPRDANGNLITQISQPGSNVLNFTLGRYGDRRLYGEWALNYARKFGNHDVSGLILFNQSDYSDATQQVDNFKKAIPYRQRNWVGRATYGYKNRYFAEANFGYSGSEAFVPSNRYGFFPSAGAGWLVSNEKFFEPLKSTISYFKLRYTYGLSGNAALNDPNKRFLYLTTIGAGASNSIYSYYFGDVPTQTTGYYESQIGGNVTWETARRQNLGVEVNFLRNELQFIVELFREERSGILLPNYIIPYNSGFTTGNIPYANIGETRNKGIDITGTYTKKWRDKDFFTFRGTFTYNKNLVIKDGLPPWQYGYQNRIGQSISQRFGYIATGYFKDQNEIDNAPKQSGDVRPGDIRYKDLNGDGIINSNDQTAIGYGSIPRIIYGLSFGGGFKGFDVSLFFQGAAMVDFNYAGGNGTIPFPNGNTYGNPYATMLDRWTVANPNQNALYPRLSTNQDNSQNYLVSTHWIQRADYIRLKSAELGYTFNNKFLKSASIRTLRIYTNGTNLWTLSKWKFWDPELGDGNGASYPNITTYNIGLRVNFQ
ncbi:TonB-dependent receptor [Chitinophagaceae bacterium LWZ2-11]